MCKVLITTVPFGDKDRTPLDQLEKNKISYLINPLGKKLTEDELCSLVGDCEVIVAGTEPITDKVMSKAKNLKMISRVGIGLDSVDLMAAERRGVVVSYTPDAPAPAVAEITIGLMYSLLRHTHESNIQLHQGKWNRFFGKRIVNCTIGLIGMGRIGTMTYNHLKALGVTNILCNDIRENPVKGITYVSKNEIYNCIDNNKISKNLLAHGVIKNGLDAVSVIKIGYDGLILCNSIYDIDDCSDKLMEIVECVKFFYDMSKIKKIIIHI